MTSGFPTPASAMDFSAGRSRTRCRRITPEAGHALEILGHAIEYLADEMMLERELISAGNARLQAVQLLMALNRQVYFECPEVPTFRERCQAFLRSHFA